ncbi:MAG: dephospho-CoA kinase [Odoribacteraceae bacterium]|jgi:dephospho-CoA kinase|nr:dephospho-CoA kinase [Odoribacteraceae bacterium]
MLTIGLTGGIGSGKTTVSGIIERLGYPVYASDPAAARIVNEDAGVKEALTRDFGKEIYTARGELDRPRFASLIFNDPRALARANEIIHPAVMRDFRRWCAARQVPLLFFESAILFEAGLAGMFDIVITVTADVETRIARVARRDHLPREKILERIHHQPGADPSRSTFIIRNNPGDMLVEQVLDIIHTLTRT